MANNTTVPNVNINVVEGIQTVIPGAIDTIMLFGTAQWGPKTVQTFSNFTDLLNTFKEDATGLTLIKAAELAYANGANTVKVVRMAESDVKATLSLLDTGAGAAITINGKFTGAYGNSITVTVTSNAITPANVDVQTTDGVIIETFDNEGAGFANNTDIVTAINATDGTGSQLVDAVLVSDTPVLDTITATNLASGDSGSTVSLTNINTALTLTNLEDYNLLLVPGFSADATHATIVSFLETRNANKDNKYCCR